MALGAQELRLRERDPNEVAAILRAHDLDNLADTIGIVLDIARDEGHIASQRHRLENVHKAASGYWNLPDKVKTAYSVAYTKHKNYYEKGLHSDARRTTRLLTKRPGILHTLSEQSPPNREPLVSIEFIASREEPYEEARLAIQGIYGEINNVVSLDLKCDVTRFQKPVRAILIPEIIALETE